MSFLREGKMSLIGNLNIELNFSSYSWCFFVESDRIRSYFIWINEKICFYKIHLKLSNLLKSADSSTSHKTPHFWRTILSNFSVVIYFVLSSVNIYLILGRFGTILACFGTKTYFGIFMRVKINRATKFGMILTHFGT